MQGFNMGRYYPPSTSDPPTFNTPSTRKKPQNQTVRFELPFAIWCTTCKPHSIIGQGVRFNAEKIRVGSYHSTPIWSFRFKHTACSGQIEVRTDPKNAEYVVHEGAQRRDYGPDGKYGGEGVGKLGGEILTEEERERRRNDAFAALEGKVADKKTAATEEKRVGMLLKAQDRDWSDPYSASQKLRRSFRADRKVRARKEREAEAIKDRLGLGIDLLDESPEDARRAALLEFGDLVPSYRGVIQSLSKPLFNQDTATSGMPNQKSARESSGPDSRTKAFSLAEKKRNNLQHELQRNTRAATDPFLLENAGSSQAGGRPYLGVKKKTVLEEQNIAIPPRKSIREATPTNIHQRTATPTILLVDYDSD